MLLPSMKRVSVRKRKFMDMGPANSQMEMLRPAVEGLRAPVREKPRVQRLLQSHRDKALDRKSKTLARVDPQRFPQQTPLEKMAVSAQVGLDYHRRIVDFKLFAKLHKYKLNPIAKLDEACCYYLNSMFKQGLELGEGSKTLAAVIDAYPGCGPKHMLPRARRALQGWLKQDPQRTRPPIPWALVAGLAMVMLKKGKLIEAALVLVMFTAYLRPGEALNLQKKDLVRPMPGHQHHALHLHPAERLEVSKVGLSDESLLLDSPVMPWLGRALETLASPDSFLFNVKYTNLVSVWKQSLKTLGLDDNHAILYQHSHTPWRKSTGFLVGHFQALQSIQRICHCCHHRCEFSGKRHIVLAGKDSNGVWWTRRAQPYPFQMCFEIANLLKLSTQ